MIDRIARITLVAIAVGTMAGCATSYDKRGVYHRVRSGESIYRIAQIYGTDVQGLAEYNNILDPDGIQPGMRLYVPQRKKKSAFKRLPFGKPVGSAEVAEAPKESGRRGKISRASDESSKPIQLYRGRFIWPVDGRLVSAFGYRDGRKHDGIDIGAKTGTSIHAAGAGKVVYAGSMRGYGNLILIRHQDDLFTAYSHNSENKVHKGQLVKQGQLIGEVGSTGRATGPHLHFEIRNGQTARNPLFFLPARVDDENGRAMRLAARQDEAKSEKFAKRQNGDATKKMKGKEPVKPKAKAADKSTLKQKDKSVGGKNGEKAAVASRKGKDNGTTVQKTHKGR
ncbi:MAG: peptidoglycan DD-metalloendopeptidase family protein [bacterium]